jgi:hypothetical protein
MSIVNRGTGRLVPFSELAKAIEAGSVPLHPYMRRKNDSINAKDSFVFDLQEFECLFLQWPDPTAGG